MNTINDDKILDKTTKKPVLPQTSQFIKVVSDDDLQNHSHVIRPIKTTQIDFYCYNSNYDKLTEWFDKSLNKNGKFIKTCANDYTNYTMDYPSITNNIDMLNWWKNNHDKYNIPLKYTNLALDNACFNNNINIIEWWFNSTLHLKYTTNCIDDASSNCNLKILDIWHNKHITDKNIDFRYTYNAIDAIYNTELTESQTLNVIKWWFKHKEHYKFKYSQQIFIDYIVQKKYTKVKEFLISNKMISDKCIKILEHSNEIEDFSTCESKNNHNKNSNHDGSNFPIKNTEEEIINQFKLLLGPSATFTDIITIGNKNEQSTNEQLKNNQPKNEQPKNEQPKNEQPKNEQPKNEQPKNNQPKNSMPYNLLGIDFMLNSMGSNINIGNNTNSNKQKENMDEQIKKLPIEIQKHLEEKKEELNYNMLTNGKTNEYIKNVLKIPFGVYREEHIFTFVQHLIIKINSINTNNKHDKIKNESDLIKIISNNKYSDEYDKYNTIYNKFCVYRVEYLEYVNSVLDKIVYGHKQAKYRIICMISKWLSGGIYEGNIIGIHGPPGIGKTTIIKNALSQCLINFIDYNLENEMYIIKNDDNNFRPFNFISLGGSTNGSTLNGHNITYQNSTCGDIVNCLKKSKIMNPIIFFDELDKISDTEHGKEIASILTHITDYSQNKHFTDRYFSEIDIDLSKCFIVFSYNNGKKIDRILMDRIYEIKLNPYTVSEKISIVKIFIIPEIIKKIGKNIEDIIIDDSIIEKTIINYTHEAGVRKLKEKIDDIITTYNYKLILNKTDKIKINGDFINEIFEDYPMNEQQKIKNLNLVGCINGMYASESGIGGITNIQVIKTYNIKDINIPEITGNIEKVMLESVKVARSVALSMFKKNYFDNSNIDYGLHVHFPEGGTNKDGPSAGTAITCAIYSLFIDKPIKNDIAITGEIDLRGNVMKIGGLDQKLLGIKNAGVKIAYIPFDNKRDYENIIKKNKNLLENFKVECVKNISELIDNIFA